MKPGQMSVAWAQASIARQVSRVGAAERNSFAAFTIYVVGATMTYGSQLVIARLAGSGGYGVYAYVLSWMTLLAYAATLGFDISTLRFVSAYRAQEAWPLIRGVIRYTERRAAVAGLVMVACGATWIWYRGSAELPELRLTFLAGFGLVPVWALLWIRCARVRAYGGIIAGLIPDRLVRDGLLVIMLGAAAFVMQRHVGAAIAMWATLLSSAIGLALATVTAHRRQPPALRDARSTYAADTWRRSVLPLVTVAIGEVAMNRTGVVLLGWSGDTRAAGIYALAFNFGLMVTLPRMAVNAWLAPTISALYARGERAALQRVVTRASALTLVGALGLALPIALLSGSLLAWFGHDFSAGIATLQILLIGQVVAAALGSQMFLLTMTGHENAAAVLLGGAAGLNAALSVGLIAMFGLDGAAWAATISVIAWNAAMGLFIWRRLRVIPGALAGFSLPRLASSHNANP